MNPKRRLLRPALTLALVVALHLLLLAAVGSLRVTPSPPAPKVIETVLLKPRPVQTEALAPQASRPPQTPRPRPAPRPVAAPEASVERPGAADGTVTAAASMTPAAEPDAPADTVSADAEPAAPAETQAQTTGKAVVETPPQAGTDRFDLPPPVVAEYSAFVNGVRNRAGEIGWWTDGRSYTLAVDVPVPFRGTYAYRSAGSIDNYGLAPVRYEETRGKQALIATNFNRDDRNSITFSRVTTTLPLVGGAQDRFSMLFQLTSLVRGNPGAYVAGVTREFYIADTTSAETWRIQCVGDDTVETDEGPLQARRFVRLPRHADDNRRLEIWLAESLGWLPVKIRQTEPGGLTADLVYKGQRASR